MNYKSRGNNKYTMEITTYHKGAHGVLSSRNGYGHLGEAQNMLRVLEATSKIRDHVPYLVI